MADPVISVIMPVFNSAAFLREAIDSVLQQSFTEFELILINDGSTDEGEAIVKSYTDPRIRYLSNDINRGLVFTLNRGIDESKGIFIARMDGDDIAFTERFKKQIDYLKFQPNVSVLATMVNLIDEKGQPIGFWKEDRENITYEQILEFMPVNNCIAHPSIMARADIMHAYRYREDQSQAEDYDLWLRLLSGGEILHKLAEPLLYHRILPGSYTRKRQGNIFLKLADTKWKFARSAWKERELNWFVVRTALFSFYDRVRGTGKQLKKIFRS